MSMLPGKLISVILLTTCLAACKKETPRPFEVVRMDKEQFKPSKLTIPAGSTVTWINLSEKIHTVTSDNGYFDSGNMEKNKKFAFSYVFSKPGTFSYHCKYHSGMSGVVEVN